MLGFFRGGALPVRIAARSIWYSAFLVHRERDCRVDGMSGAAPLPRLDSGDIQVVGALRHHRVAVVRVDGCLDRRAGAGRLPPSTRLVSTSRGSSSTTASICCMLCVLAVHHPDPESWQVERNGPHGDRLRGPAESFPLRVRAPVVRFPDSIRRAFRHERIRPLQAADLYADRLLERLLRAPAGRGPSAVPARVITRPSGNGCTTPARGSRTAGDARRCGRDSSRSWGSAASSSTTRISSTSTRPTTKCRRRRRDTSSTTVDTGMRRRLRLPDPDVHLELYAARAPARIARHREAAATPRRK